MLNDSLRSSAITIVLFTLIVYVNAQSANVVDIAEFRVNTERARSVFDNEVRNYALTRDAMELVRTAATILENLNSDSHDATKNTQDTAQLKEINDLGSELRLVVSNQFADTLQPGVYEGVGGQPWSLSAAVSALAESSSALASAKVPSKSCLQLVTQLSHQSGQMTDAILLDAGRMAAACFAKIDKEAGTDKDPSTKPKEPYNNLYTALSFLYTSKAEVSGNGASSNADAKLLYDVATRSMIEVEKLFLMLHSESEEKQGVDIDGEKLEFQHANANFHHNRVPGGRDFNTVVGGLAAVTSNEVTAHVNFPVARFPGLSRGNNAYVSLLPVAPGLYRSERTVDGVARPTNVLALGGLQVAVDFRTMTGEPLSFPCEYESDAADASCKVVDASQSNPTPVAYIPKETVSIDIPYSRATEAQVQCAYWDSTAKDWMTTTSRIRTRAREGVTGDVGVLNCQISESGVFTIVEDSGNFEGEFAVQMSLPEYVPLSLDATNEQKQAEYARIRAVSLQNLASGTQSIGATVDRFVMRVVELKPTSTSVYFDLTEAPTVSNPTAEAIYQELRDQSAFATSRLRADDNEITKLTRADSFTRFCKDLNEWRGDCTVIEQRSGGGGDDTATIIAAVAAAIAAILIIAAIVYYYNKKKDEDGEDDEEEAAAPAPSQPKEDPAPVTDTAVAPVGASEAKTGGETNESMEPGPEAKTSDYA